MTAPFTIRGARPSDTPAILRLLRGLAEYEHLAQEVTASETGLHDALFAPHPRIQAIVASIGNESVGLALYYYTFSTFKLCPNLFLEDLFVESRHRGSGIGLALMRHLAQCAVSERCARMEWRVLNWNQPSIDFYRRIGSRPIEGWHTRQLGGDALAALAEGNLS